MSFRAVGAALICATYLATPVRAHHSHGNYDVSKWTVVEGVVRQIVFIAPHSIVHLDVKNAKGETTIWALEATNPQTIFLKGLKREDVRAGDPIRVRCHLLRDGNPGCLLGFVTPLHGDKTRGHGVELEWD